MKKAITELNTNTLRKREKIDGETHISIRNEVTFRFVYQSIDQRRKQRDCLVNLRDKQIEYTICKNSDKKRGLQRKKKQRMNE